MKPKKENSGGKKFQERQPAEKRVRVTKKPKTYQGKTSRSFSSDEREGPPKNKKSFGFKSRDTESNGKKKFERDKPFKSEKKPKKFETYQGKTPRSFSSSEKEGFPKNKKSFGFKSRDTGSNAKKKFESVSGKYFKEDKSGNRKSKPENFKGARKNYQKTGESLLKGKSLVEGEVRLNRFIANSGLCSRREADVMIEQGLVTLNGKVVTQLGSKVNPGDEVKVDGKRINPEKPVYILLNKPKGYITTTTDPSDRATVLDLIDLPGKERIYPIGRLDRNTTGVLLLTNDGELAQKLMHPSFEIKKIYKARLDQKPSKDHMLAWVNGVELEDGFMSFEQIGFVDEEDPTILGLEVHSGRNRIVRRMFEHFGYEVISLDRVMLGDFDHLKLGRGKWRFLNEKEIRYVEQLKRMKGKKPKK